MAILPRRPEFSGVTQSGTDNLQQVGNGNTINNYLSPALEAKKSSIFQDILEDIIELEVTLDVSQPDTVPFNIESKISHNKILFYKEAYEFFMAHRFIIEDRLSTLEANGNPLATKKLFIVVKNIYNKYCLIKDPDEIITLIQNELKADLINVTSHDNITFIPSIIFYVFSECKIFEKPPL